MDFDCNNAIKQVFEFSGDPKGIEPELNIAWGVDRNFLFGAVVSMTSTLLHNRKMKLHLHLFTDYIDDDYQQKINALAVKYAANITIYFMDASALKILPCGNAWSYATYFRFIAFEYLSGSVDSILYIDADVICKGSLADLNQLNLDGYAAAVVRDIDDSPSRNLKEKPDYFNAGVIFANLREWNKNNFFKSAFDILLDKKQSLPFFDQDVLNILFLGKVIFLPRIYNAIYGIKQELKSKDITRYKEYITADTILIHYIGVTKPWNTWANYPSAQYFIDAWKASPLLNAPLLPARTPKQYKKKSRHERLQGKYISSIASYIGYLIQKIKTK
ncbi:lipopolysaccharide 1,2-glucosyltransferase [Enterobacteriaceae bacterium YMB-R22]|uniref:glycosyltransferase family 8 protein n=1 Tax=Tenebrionicola larvae TaxID=2815733 RepID=UPI0020126ACB|nr:glycosyltransferase [Tenebrionicola larvae]MBV4412793.1 lipopolysaccharide 1,2-glucosyltransferase [Tenebrionicola larvae]